MLCPRRQERPNDTENWNSHTGRRKKNDHYKDFPTQKLDLNPRKKIGQGEMGQGVALGMENFIENWMFVNILREDLNTWQKNLIWMSK